MSRAKLIKRFIHRQAKFVWLSDIAGGLQMSRYAIDFDGAWLSHIGDRETFEALVASVALENDPKLQPIAATVHYLNVGSIPSAEAAGLEAGIPRPFVLHTKNM